MGSLTYPLLLLNSVQFLVSSRKLESAGIVMGYSFMNCLACLITLDLFRMRSKQAGFVTFSLSEKTAEKNPKGNVKVRCIVSPQKQICLSVSVKSIA